MTTEESNPVAYARGVLQAEVENCRHHITDARSAIEVLVAAVAGGREWEIDQAVASAVLVANRLEEQE